MAELPSLGGSVCVMLTAVGGCVAAWRRQRGECVRLCVAVWMCGWLCLHGCTWPCGSSSPPDRTSGL